MKFKAHSDCNYKYDYAELFADTADGKHKETDTYRSLILDDLFFIVYFVLGIEEANVPFVVQACRDVEDGPETKTMDLWARGHFKTSIITIAETIQQILSNPEERIAIFSHNRPAAKSILRIIKLLFEGSQLLKECFPDILFPKPQVEAPKWSEDDGLIVQRKGFYNEATLEAWGLIEGMPTGKHFTKRKYDDIETPEMVTTPEVIDKLKSMYEVSQNLKDKDGTHRVIGTPYHHAGLLQYLKEQVDAEGNLKYFMRLKPATEDGTPSGKPVLLSDEALKDLKTNRHFNSQQLLDPTPLATKSLRGNLLRTISPHDIPSSVYKFMPIDPAGDSINGKGDAWAFMVAGVEPVMDEVGTSNIYILDLVISTLRDAEAIDMITKMYVRNGMVLQVGVEKVGLSSVEVHVANALAAQGRNISIENKTLEILKPAGRKKIKRIEDALAWPLYNSKIFISDVIPGVYSERLISELDRFPYWHDDGIDALSYLYDMIKVFNFPKDEPTDIPVESEYPIFN